MFISVIAAKLAAYRRYRESVRELSRLSDRELSDLGIARCDIEFVARQSARLAVWTTGGLNSPAQRSDTQAACQRRPIGSSAAPRILARSIEPRLRRTIRPYSYCLGCRSICHRRRGLCATVGASNSPCDCFRRGRRIPWPFGSKRRQRSSSSASLRDATMSPTPTSPSYAGNSTTILAI